MNEEGDDSPQGQRQRRAAVPECSECWAASRVHLREVQVTGSGYRVMTRKMAAMDHQKNGDSLALCLFLPVELRGITEGM